MKEIQTKNRELTLLPIESSLLARYIIGVSTITLFEGDLASVEAFISKRFRVFCQLNPWILASLIDDGKKTPLRLSYQEPFDEQDFAKSLEFNLNNLRIRSNMSYEEILVQTAPYLVQSPKMIVNTDALVSSLIFEPLVDNPNAFVMIFSLSHSLVDGHSYYKILNMLFANEEIVALDIKRKTHLYTKLRFEAVH
ncbi:MAG: hypothetical protein QM493_01455, partial [Sulfurovum sp.]